MSALVWPFFGIAVVSLFFFPWPLTALLALALTPFAPLAPLSLGLAADALYLPTAAWPLATCAGLVASAIALFVRHRLAAGIMGG